MATEQAFIRALYSYEPGLVDRVRDIVQSTPVELVRRSGWAQFEGDSDLQQQFAPGGVWATFDRAGIIAGPAVHSATHATHSFSFRIHGPKHSAYYGHVLQVTVSDWMWDYAGVTVTLADGSPLFHANCVETEMLYLFDDCRFVPLAPGAQILAIAARVSVLLVDPDPNGDWVTHMIDDEIHDDLRHLEGNDELYDHLFEIRQSGPCADKYGAAVLLLGCMQNNEPHVYFEEAARVTPPPPGGRLAHPSAYLPSTTENKENPDPALVSVVVVLPDGTTAQLDYACTVMDIRQAVGRLNRVGPWSLLTVVHHGRCIGYDAPFTPLQSCGVADGDTLLIDQRNAMHC